MKMELVQLFPSLVIQSVGGMTYSGYINVSGHEFMLKLYSQHGDLSDFRMECDQKMASLLYPIHDLISQRLKQSKDLAGFLTELKVLMEERIRSQKLVGGLNCSSFHSKLMEQISDLGWDKISYVSDSLQIMEIKVQDDERRNHQLKLRITDQFPDISPDYEATLPEPFNVRWNSSLIHLYNQFMEKINQYQEFWSVMDDIDKNTWVLEPEKPSRADVRRRIAMASNASIVLIINPNQPNALPEFRFLGPERITKPLKEKLLSKDSDQWEPDRSVLTNIREILDVQLPSPSTTREEEYRVECGMCYTHLLGESVPEHTCENQKCDHLYHQSCVYEWLRREPSSRLSFGMIFGKCIYCNEPISAPVTTSNEWKN